MEIRKSKASPTSLPVLSELGLGDLFRFADDAEDVVRMVDDEGGYISLCTGVRFLIEDSETEQVHRVRGHFVEEV